MPSLRSQTPSVRHPGFDDGDGGDPRSEDGLPRIQTQSGRTALGPLRTRGSKKGRSDVTSERQSSLDLTLLPLPAAGKNRNEPRDPPLSSRNRASSRRCLATPVEPARPTFLAVN